MNRKKLEEDSSVILIENCYATTLNKLPKNISDPSSLTILCQFGNLATSDALADSGASVKLMPYSFLKKLNFPKPKHIRMSIHLANKTVTFPWGIVEYFLVKVDNFVFYVGFVVLDMEEDNQFLIILIQPFLSTT